MAIMVKLLLAVGVTTAAVPVGAALVWAVPHGGDASLANAAWLAPRDEVPKTIEVTRALAPAPPPSPVATPRLRAAPKATSEPRTVLTCSAWTPVVQGERSVQMCAEEPAENAAVVIDEATHRALHLRRMSAPEASAHAKSPPAEEPITFTFE